MYFPFILFTFSLYILTLLLSLLLIPLEELADAGAAELPKFMAEVEEKDEKKQADGRRHG